LLPLWWLQQTIVGLDTIPVVVVAAAAAIGLLFFSVSARYALVLPAVVLLWFAFATERIERFDHGFPKASVGALYQGITAPQRDWIDAAVGRDADVAFVYSGKDPTHHPDTLWENEFFNRSIGPVFYADAPMEGGLASTKVTLDRRSGVLRGAPDVPFVLTDGSAELVGDVVAKDGPRNIFLYRVDRPLRQAAVVEGLHPADTWSGPSVTYTRFACDGGTVAVALQSDVALYQEPSRVRVLGTKVSATVPPDGRAHVLVAPLKSARGRCLARFAISPTRVPGPNDPRELGLHFNSFRYAP